MELKADWLRLREYLQKRTDTRKYPGLVMVIFCSKLESSENQAGGQTDATMQIFLLLILATQPTNYTLSTKVVILRSKWYF